MPTAPVSIACPHCRRQFRVRDDLIGQRIKCKCGEKFVAEAATAPARTRNAASPAPTDDMGSLLAALDEVSAPLSSTAIQPSPSTSKTHKAKASPLATPATEQAPTTLRRSRGDTPSAPRGMGLKLAAIGMYFEAVGGLLITAAIAFLITGAVLARMAAAGDKAMAGQVLIAGVIILSFGVLVMLVGPILFLAAPNAAGRFRALGAIGAFFVGMIVAIVVGAMDRWWGSIAGGALGTLAMALIIAFYSSFSRYLGDRELEGRAGTLKSLFIVVIVGQVIAGALRPVVPPIAGFQPVAVISLVVLIAQVAMLLGYVTLSSRMARATFRG